MMALLSNTALSSANSFYQSRLTQTRLIISFHAAGKCRALAIILQLHIKTHMHILHFQKKKQEKKKRTLFIYIMSSPSADHGQQHKSISNAARASYVTFKCITRRRHDEEQANI